MEINSLWIMPQFSSYCSMWAQDKKNANILVEQNETQNKDESEGQVSLQYWQGWVVQSRLQGDANRYKQGKGVVRGRWAAPRLAATIQGEEAARNT